MLKKNNILEKKQLDTRKNKSSTNASMINEFIIYTDRTQHQTIVIQHNDTIVYYNRITATMHHSIVDERILLKGYAHFDSILFIQLDSTFKPPSVYLKSHTPIKNIQSIVLVKETDLQTMSGHSSTFPS